jgi:hypothetical protein
MSDRRTRPRRLSRGGKRLMHEAVEPRLLLATYYVSPAGNDAADGTSTGTAWQSVERVNAQDLNGGDKVLFQGGQTFSVPAGARGSIVANGGFETGTFASWSENLQGTNKTSITSAAGTVHGGTYAARIDGAGARGQDLSALVRPNRSYLLSFWAKFTPGSGNVAYVGVTCSNPFGNSAAYFQIPATGTYQQYTIGLTVPPGTFYADAWATNSTGTSILYLDDFSLAESQVLRFDDTDSGTAGNPVVIGSYGAGRATLNAGAGTAILAENVSGFEVRDLNLTGTWNGLAATGDNAGYGFFAVNTQPGSTKLDHVYVDNVDVRGFKFSGIELQGQADKSGFINARVTNATVHDGGDVGIQFGSTNFSQTATTYAHANAYVGNCTVYNIGGLPGWGRHSGDGIILSDVNGGTIERCVAYNNGEKNNNSGGGPVGIWAWDANAVTIQFNESYGNKTGAGAADGGGFDLDGGSTNCVVQYNYSHDNMGPGLLLYQFTGARPYGNNTVRYNISQNDARAGDYGSIYLGGAGSNNNAVYNNTVYFTPTATPTAAAIKLFQTGTGNNVRNNIFYTTAAALLLHSDAAYPTTTVQFQGNDFYSAGTFGISWGGVGYASLPAWRAATNQEKNGSFTTGISADPQFVSPGGGTTVGDASRLHLMYAYQLLPGSPCINAGFDLAGGAGPRDYYGQAVPYVSQYDIGAFEWRNRATGSSGNDAFAIRAGANNSTEVFINSPATGVPTIGFASGVYTFYAFDALAGSDTLDYNGPLAVSVNFFAGNNSGSDTFNLNSGTFDINSDFVVGTDITVNVAAGARANFSQARSFTALNLAGSATLASGGATRLTLGALNLTGAGKLDLNDNALIVDYAPGNSPIGSWSGLAYSGLTGKVGAGRNGGAWNGVAGITSSTAAANPSHRSLAIAEASDVIVFGAGQTTALFAGRTVDQSSVLIRYTISGDADLNGKLNGDDYFLIDLHAANPTPPNVRWTFGDFDYNGKINGDDYFTLDSNLSQTPLLW